MKRCIALICILMVMISALAGCESVKDERNGIIHLRWVTYGSAVPDDIGKIIEAANN